MSNATTPDREPIEMLEDQKLFEFIDRHLFGFSFWCTGPCDYWFQRGYLDIYKCRVCGTQVLSDGFHRLPAQHIRRVPSYRSEQIIEAMKGQAKAVQRQFILALRVAAGESTATCHSTTTVLAHVLFNMTPRSTAIAALQALRIIDARGKIIEQSTDKDTLEQKAMDDV
uniref:Uncharacterized protein n=1 Tax=Thermosporothrix sp. COM3 TaxID=2490863 RepID=A0A455SVW3_9CHLR|nr:hypothetical protein KTC_64670 [Thermosporothrix sp. COM3]